MQHCMAMYGIHQELSMFDFSGSYKRSLLPCLTLAWRLYSSLERIDTIVIYWRLNDSNVTSCQHCFVMLLSFNMSLANVRKTLKIEPCMPQGLNLFHGHAFWRPYTKHKEVWWVWPGWLLFLTYCRCMLHEASKAFKGTHCTTAITSRTKLINSCAFSCLRQQIAWGLWAAHRIELYS